MAKAVIILGAGASADFGVPVLRSVFKDRQAKRYLEENQDLHNLLRELFWDLRGCDIESSDKSLTVEEMLTVLRDWENEASGQCPHPDSVDRLRKGIYILIQRAVFVGKSTRAKHLNPLIEIARECFEYTTWASFNWDCIFESSFYYSQPWEGPGSRFNPSLAVQIRNWHSGVMKHKFLKLHGGINWWMIDGHLTYLKWSGGGALQMKWDEYSQNPGMENTPVILEPSYYKYEDEVYRILSPQWDLFFQRLCEADVVIIMGYSLPEADSEARSKIMTAFQTNTECKWLVVDPSETVRDRYRRLLGEKSLRVLDKTLAGFNNEIREDLQESFPDVDFSEARDEEE